MILFCCFFFFKQKTAYEMRISDWSSDVCSSDLSAVISRSPRKFESMSRRCVMPANISGLRMEVNWYYTGINMQQAAHPSSTLMFAEASEAGQIVAKQLRSEEHTSELQSLMRSSYAVFCLKNKSIEIPSQSEVHNVRTQRNTTCT